MFDLDKQRKHYDEVMSNRKPTKGLSCGYDSRFDPFLLDKRPELSEEFNNLFNLAIPNKVGKLLDIGCGSGMYFPALCRKADEITGIDISPEMIKAAQELVDSKNIPNISLMTMSADDLQFEDESFDLVLGFDVLHHLPDVSKALSEINRVLRSGGKFISVEPNVLNPIVFVIHAIPPEERGALRFNYPWATRSLLLKHFDRVESMYVNHVTAPNNQIILAGVRLTNALTKIWPLKYFSIRMLWRAQKS